MLGFGVAAAESTASGAALEPKHSVVHSLHPRHFLGDLLHGRAHLLLRLDILVDAPDMAVQEQMLAAGGCAATIDATSPALATPTHPAGREVPVRGALLRAACSPVEARVLAESELLVVKALDALLEALLDHPAGRAHAHVSTRCGRPVTRAARSHLLYMSLKAAISFLALATACCSCALESPISACRDCALHAVHPTVQTRPPVSGSIARGGARNHV